MKRKILILVILLFNSLIFAQEKKEVSNFFGYNSWYHYSDENNYYCRSILNNGKYKILIICEDGKISSYFHIVGMNNPIHMPFSITVYKHNQNRIEIQTGEGATNYSTYIFDINKNFVEIKGDEEGDVDSPVKVKSENNQITIEYQFRTYYHRLNDDFDYVRDGFNKTCSYKEVFKDKNLNDMKKFIIGALYEHRFSSINELSTNGINQLKEILSYFEKSELRMMRNLLYAMHDYKFKSNDLNLLFSNFKWYAPIVTDSTKIQFTENEKEIMEYIIELESRKA